MLMLLAALAAQIAPPPDRPQRSERPSPTISPAPTAVGSGQFIEKTIPAGGGGSSIIEASVGDTVRITVEGDDLAMVELQGLDEIEALDPESPAIFEVYTDREGSFPVIVVETQREIGRLEVSP